MGSMLTAALNLIERKQSTMASRKLREVKLENQLENLTESGEVQAGCNVCAMLFGSRRGRGGPLVEGVQGKTSSAAKLEQAQASLKERTERLQERMTESRREAVLLMKSGKKVEALAAMKRAKMAEKQYLTASSAVDALDQQILSLEEASLQQEIATALSSSVKKVKKQTKGLLDKTEKAVDGSAEVKDLAEDVNSALEGLHSGGAVDEDDLMDELQSMLEDADEEEQVAASTAPTVENHVEMQSWPSVPAERLVGTARKRNDGFQQLLPAVR